jgi:hypothetical protein
VSSCCVTAPGLAAAPNGVAEAAIANTANIATVSVPVKIIAFIFMFASAVMVPPIIFIFKNKPDAGTLI